MNHHCCWWRVCCTSACDKLASICFFVKAWEELPGVGAAMESILNRFNFPGSGSSKMSLCHWTRTWAIMCKNFWRRRLNNPRPDQSAVRREVGQAPVREAFFRCPEKSIPPAKLPPLTKNVTWDTGWGALAVTSLSQVIKLTLAVLSSRGSVHSWQWVIPSAWCFSTLYRWTYSGWCHFRFLKKCAKTSLIFFAKRKELWEVCWCQNDQIFFWKCAKVLGCGGCEQFCRTQVVELQQLHDLDQPRGR